MRSSGAQFRTLPSPRKAGPYTHLRHLAHCPPLCLARLYSHGLQGRGHSHAPLVAPGILSSSTPSTPCMCKFSSMDSTSAPFACTRPRSFLYVRFAGGSGKLVRDGRITQVWHTASDERGGMRECRSLDTFTRTRTAGALTIADARTAFFLL